MAPIQDKLAALSSAAAALNTSTDSLNTIIETLETRLAEMRIGVFVELDDLIDEKRPTYETNSEGERDRKVIRGWKLGYGKLGDTWRIFVTRGYREAEYADAEAEKTQYGHDADWEFIAEGDPVPLVKAPRLVRVEAINSFEELITALTERANWYAQSIEKAKALAEH